MPEKIATDEAVSEAADVLLAEGRTPTARLVFERIGGSYTTIGAALKRWKEARAATAHNPPPQDVSAQGQRYVQALWQRQLAMQQAAAATEEAQQAARAKVQEAEAELAFAAEQNRQFEERCQALAGQLAESQTSLERERAQALGAAQRLSRIEAELQHCRLALEAARQGEQRQNGARRRARRRKCGPQTATVRTACQPARPRPRAYWPAQRRQDVTSLEHVTVITVTP